MFHFCYFTNFSSRERLLLAALFAWMFVSPPLFAGVPRGLDCNLNGRVDAEDVSLGASEDCNSNDVPDECETAQLEIGFRDGGLEVQEHIASLWIGDLNDDGNIDVLTGHRFADGTNPMSLLFGLGGGEFAPQEHHGLDFALRNLALADLDGDGDPDLAALDTRTIAIFENPGDGFFTKRGEIALSEAGIFVAAADLNRDGMVDLLTADRLKSSVTVFWGDGNFEYSPGPTFAAARSPIWIEPADLDGDGDLDVVVAGRLGVLTVTLQQEDGTFSEPESYEASSALFVTRTADLDSDGDVDVVTGDGVGMTVWENDGTGRLERSWDRAAPLSALILADMDSDGALDIVTGSDDFRLGTVYRNLGGFVFDDQLTFGGGSGAHVRAEDIDRDGDVDVVIASSLSPRIDIAWNGDPRNAVLVPIGVVDVLARPHGAALGDMDGDGLVDVVTGDGPAQTVSVLLNSSQGKVQAPRKYRVQVSRVEAMATADFDLDGNRDMVTAARIDNQVLVFLGKGALEFDIASYEVGSNPFMIAPIDLEGDSDPDLLVSNRESNNISVLTNSGDGTFLSGRPITTGSGPQAIAPGDFDSDGDVDFAVAVATGAAVAVYFNDGDGTFSEPELLPLAAGPSWIVASDLDADGDLDLVSAVGNSTLVFFWNDGAAGFHDVTVSPVNSSGFSLTVGDVTGDGRPDILTANSGQDTISVVAAARDGGFLPPFDVGVGRTPLFVLPLDLDGDGDFDVVSADHDGRQLSHLLNKNDALTTEADFFEHICTPRDFVQLSVPGARGDVVERSVKYVLPARDDPALLPTVFQNLKKFQLHQEFLGLAFPERFPALTIDEYDRLTARRASRQYWVGVIHRLQHDGERVYGVTAIVDSSDREELPTQTEIADLLSRLRQSFALEEPLGYFPDTQGAKDAAQNWSAADFPIFITEGPPPVSFEAYTTGVGFGRVRVLDAEGFKEANETGQISFQSVLVLEEAPRDIEGVVGGVITAARQGPLSHVAIRTARRGTPNAFLLDATEELRPLDGELVRVEVTAGEVHIEVALVEEAEAFWAANRPSLSELPEIDADFDALASLEEIAGMDLSESQELRFGGKATNLARLGHLLDGSRFASLREVGFGIPIRYYLEFLRSNTLSSAIDPGREVTYEEYLLELFENDDFKSDSAIRFEALDTFRSFARDNGVVDEDLVARILARIPEIFGSEDVPVRFRSSSNVEDALEFNGAGLYESTGGCAADDADEDDVGPSICDASKDNERGVRRALKKVWTSLYTFRAFEERNFFGIAEELVGMGILVSRAFPDELANGVAFTGNISNARDRNFVVTVQLGEESVVSPEPGTFPERDVLEIAEGEVRRILRPQQGSTLVEPGVWILSDAQLRELGAFLAFVDEGFPLDLGSRRRDDVLLDLEFKLQPDESLAFKQVRPFLLSGPPPATPTFELEVPLGYTACGVFGISGVDRGPREEYERKSQIRFRPGVHLLPTVQESFELDLFEEVRFGPDAELAEPLSPGVFRVRRVPDGSGGTVYPFTFGQEFILADGRIFELNLFSPLVFRAVGNEILEKRQVLDESFLVVHPGNEAWQGVIDGLPLVRYGSCTYDDIFAFGVEAELADGNVLRFEERWRPPPNLFETGPGALVAAELLLGAERRVVRSYWDLVYSSSRHNTFVTYWVILDPPVTLPGVEEEVFGVELQFTQIPQPPLQSAAYLGRDLLPVATVDVSAFRKGATLVIDSPGFLRGDVDASGGLDVRDALQLLDHLFRRGSAPDCRKAADANDDGRLDLLDVLALVGVQFRGRDGLPDPFSICGEDPTVDELSCDAFGACP